MNLFVRSSTLREGKGFPEALRQTICQAVKMITAEELPQLLARHETHPDNFDGRVEKNLRVIASALTVRPMAKGEWGDRHTIPGRLP